MRVIPEQSGSFVVGVDGCRGGWVAVWLTGKAPRKTGAAVYSTFAELWSALGHAGRILVDMPIGLPGKGARRCDLEARRVLGPRLGSRVFPCPGRAALSAGDYAEACQNNQRQLGRKLSKQSYFLLPKIRECDTLLQSNPTARAKIFEAHPEACFAGLAGGSGLRASKKTAEGQAQRVGLLKDCQRGLGPCIQGILEQTRRVELLPDDALDAAVLAYAASVAKRWRVLPEEGPPEFDETGLPMRIVGLKPPRRPGLAKHSGA